MFVTKDGRVKILDFGLAKLQPPRDASEDLATQKQITSPGALKTMLSDGYWSARGLAWSPDSKEVLFSASLSGGN